MAAHDTRCKLVAMQPHRPERSSAIVVAVLVVGFTTWVLLILPIQAAFILTVAAVLGWVAWIKTTYARPVNSRRVIVVYLCAVAFQLIHMSEEYTGGFPHEIVDLFDSPGGWSEKSLLLIYLLVDESRRLEAEAARTVPNAVPAGVTRAGGSGARAR